MGRSTRSELQDGLWFGDVVSISDLPPGKPPLGYVRISMNNDRNDNAMLGTISLAGASYLLLPQEDDRTAIVQWQSTSDASYESPPDQRMFWQEPPVVLPTIKGHLYKVRVMIAYTPEAKRVLTAGSTSTMDDEARDFLNEANEAFDRSGLGKVVKVVPAGRPLEVTQLNTGNWKQDKENFVKSDRVRMERNTQKADISILLFTDTGLCGQAQQVLAKPQTAFAVVAVRQNCLRKLVFTHELAHLFGAAHNAERAFGTAVYPYAHGHFHKDGATIMAYPEDCPIKPCGVIPYFSNPNIVVHDKPLGHRDKYYNALVIYNFTRYVSEFHNTPLPTTGVCSTSEPMSGWYKIRRKEWLSTIARRKYHDESKWKNIYCHDDNAGLRTLTYNPARIPAGKWIALPKREYLECLDSMCAKDPCLHAREHHEICPG